MANDPVCFIAYSADDEESVIVKQKLVALLERPMQALGLRLFVDNRIMRGPAESTPEAREALESAAHAVVLVGPQLLASSTSQAVDLEALIERVHQRDGRTLPILVDYCLWSRFAYLQVEFMNDVDRPIVAISHDKDALSRELSSCAKRILDACTPHSQVAAGSSTRGTSSGQGHQSIIERKGDFPLLPESIWRRDDLISTVVHALSQSTTPGRRMVQLVGEAGIGKSVLAAIISEESGVRARYMDGIYWLTAGVASESYDLLLGFARLLEVGEPLITERDALRVLRTTLQTRKLLVIIDDVVSRDQIEAFRVLDSGSALLSTGRRETSGTHSLVIPVPRLSSGQAKEYLSHQPSGVLSPEEEGVLIGLAKGVPLALSIGCAVLATASDRSLAITLLERDDFGDHPFADSFRSVSAAMATLGSHDQDLVKALAVYPAGSRIPVVEVVRWWAWLAGTTPDEASLLLGELSRMKLADVVQGEGEAGVRIQALVQAYLTFMADEPLSVLHAAWARSHHVDHKSRRLSDVPLDDHYFWAFAPFHLRMAGRWNASVILDPGFMVSRACAGGVEAVLMDLGSVLGETSRERGFAAAAHRELQRYAHLTKELDRPEQWAASLRVWLEHRMRRPSGEWRGPWSAALGWPGVPPVGATTLVEHTHWVTGVAWLGSDRLVSCDAAGHLICWSAELGTIIWRHAENAAIVRLCTVYGCDGQTGHIAYGLEDGRVLVRDESGRLISNAKPHIAPVTAVALGADAVVSGAVDGSLSFRVLSDQGGWARALSSPVSALLWAEAGGPHVVVGQEDGLLLSVALSSEQIGDAQEVLGEEIQGIHQSSGELVLVGRSGVILRFRDGHAAHVTGGGGVVTASAITATGEMLLGRASGVVERVDLESGELLGRVAAHQSWCRAIDARESSSRILTAGDDGMVRIWDADQSPELSTRSGLTQQTARQVAFSATGEHLAGVGADGSVCIWDTGSGESVFEATLEAPGCSIAWGVSGLAALTEVGSLYVWPDAGKQSFTLVQTEHFDWPRLIAYAANGTLLVSAGDDGQIMVRGTPSLDLLGRLKFPRERFRAFAELEGDCFAVGGSDGLVCWLRVAGGDVILEDQVRIPGLLAVRSLSRVPDSDHLVVGDSGGAVVMLDQQHRTLQRWRLEGRVRAASMWDDCMGTAVDSRGWVHRLAPGSAVLRSRIAERITAATVSSTGQLAVCTDYGIGILKEMDRGNR